MDFFIFYSAHIPSKYLIVMLRATVQLVFVFTVRHYLLYHTVNPSSVVPTAVYHIIRGDNERSKKRNLLFLAMYNDFHAYYC